MSTTFWGRFDSNSANNPALNMTGDPAIELTFLAQTPGGGPGDFELDQPAAGVGDPDTVVEIDGVTYSFIFELTGVLPTTKKNGSQQVPDQFEGIEGYTISVVDYPTPGDLSRVFFMPGVQATEAEMNDFGNGAIDIQNIDTAPPPSPVCFAAGTRICTLRGEIRVEQLGPGDMVATFDHGFQPVQWIASTRIEWPGASEAFKPIEIKAETFGPNVPSRDLVLSPQHKVLVTIPDAGHMGGDAEYLVPVKGLVGRPGVRRQSGKKSVCYYHVLLGRHALIWSEGLLSESFYPGASAMNMLSLGHRLQVRQLIPGLSDDPVAAYGPKSRACLTVRESQVLAGPILSGRTISQDHQRVA